MGDVSGIPIGLKHIFTASSINECGVQCDQHVECCSFGYTASVTGCVLYKKCTLDGLDKRPDLLQDFILSAKGSFKYTICGDASLGSHHIP